MPTVGLPNWKPLRDVWSFSTAKGEWTRLALDLPAPAGHASGDYDPKRGLVLLAAYPETRDNKKVPLLTLKLDLASAPKAAAAAAVDPKLEYHSKAWGSLLPDEWLEGAFAPGDGKAGLRSLEALPANTWVVRKPPVVPPGRDWGSCIYDPRTHRGYAWGGGHSTYPGADVIEYDLGLDRWRGMSDAVNYNPAWLHGMVSGPPGVSAGGWSLLPTHSRKSYGIDVKSNALSTYVGDVYDLKHRMYISNIGRCPGLYGVATQVSFCSTPHGLYGYSSNTLAKASVAEGRWEEVAKGGIMSPDLYNAFGAMHGTIMVFLAIVPLAFAAFGNYVVPLQIGAVDMAFPRVNMASFQCFFLGGVVMLASFFIPGGAAKSGWTSYSPLATLAEVSVTER